RKEKTDEKNELNFCTIFRFTYYILVVFVKMKRNDFIFQTADGQTIQAYRWDNEAIETIGVIQIAHGMVEHSLRYETFISFLTSNGFIVYANDHRGHGRSYKKKKDRG